MISTTTTDSSGQYRFTGLSPGDYRVAVTDTGRVLSALTLIDKPAASTVKITCSPSCETVNTQDFGYGSATTGSGSIGDTVYFDKDGNEARDTGEPGIPGVTVELLDTTGKVVLATKVTGADGQYRFTGLAAGSYSVRVATSPSDQGSVLFGLTPKQKAANPISITCPTASTCDQVDAADFGFAPTTGGTGTLGGTVWRDTNANGTLQSGEPGIQGVTVELWLDVNGDKAIQPGTDNLVRTATTNVNGDYQFLGLPAGNYLVKVTDANGVTAGMTAVTGPSPTLDGNGHENPYAVTLPTGATDTSADFGYKAETTGYSVSGTVFEDNGGAGTLGVNDGPTTDPVAVGATVTLYRVVNGQQYLVGAVMTGASGYSFTGLPAGDYLIKVNTSGTIVEGFEQTADPDQRGVPCTTCDSQASITLGPNAVEVSFGYWNGGVITTPITLSYFRADPGRTAGSVIFQWATATEVGNVGFDLYVEDTLGEWQRVNQRLIRAMAGDSVEVRNYRFEAENVQGTVFMIVDIDVKGHDIWHGPFTISQDYGVKNPPTQPTNWDAINAEHESKKKDHDQRKQDKMKEKMKKQKDKLKKGGLWDEVSTTTESWAGRVAAAMLSFLVGTAEAAELPVLDTGLQRLEVSASGIQRVTYENLKAAGVDLNGVDPKVIAVTNRGKNVPLYVNKGANKKGFGPGGYIEFVGEPLDTLYTKTNVYNLYLDATMAARVQEDDAKPPKNAVPVAYYMDTVRVEPEKIWSFGSPNGDPWYATDMEAYGGPYSGAFDITADAYAGSVAPVTLTVDLWGGSYGKHHVEIFFNDGSSPVADEVFDGHVDHPVSVEAPAGTLHEGINTLTINLPLDVGEDYDWVPLDAYSLTYPRRFTARGDRLTFRATGSLFKVDGLASQNVRVYRVEGAGRVALINNVETAAVSGRFSASFAGTSAAATYHVSAVSSLASPALAPPVEQTDLTTGKASYLIIAHPDFLGPDLEDLAAVRQSQGYSVKIADLKAVYSHFGDGILDPQAIRDYIAYAYRNLETRMVLLVGGDTYDYFNYRGLKAVSFVPSLYAQTDELVRFAPVDPKYADIDGDDVPDLAIGRLPARNSAELGVLIQKTLTYEGASGYAQTSVFVADAYDKAQRYNFKRDAEAMAERLPSAWQPNLARAYIDDLGKTGARNLLLAKLNAGVALTSFVGHSGPTYWTFSGLFSATDAAKLTNVGKPTVVTQWGCWNTFYVGPKEDTLAHQFLLNGNKGAAAVLGASTLTEASHERGLALMLYDHVFEQGVTLGEAVLQAKRAYAADNPGHKDVILGWTLLGDPAVMVGP